MNRFQFVEDHQRRHGVKRLCTILGIARSSFYYWRKTAADRAARQAADAKLAAKIRAVHWESDGTYGVPRITAELREDGEHVNHKRVARVMRTIGLAGVRLRRRHRTTVPDPVAAKAPDRIGRDFTAEEVNTKYVGDIMYLSIGGGKFCYLATVIDLASRRLAGWALADHMRTELVIDALAAAERTRGSLKGAILHTEHASAVGSSADNAAAESFNATFKRESLQGRKGWSSEREARLDAFRWLHRYNTRRRYSRLGYRSSGLYPGIRCSSIRSEFSSSQARMALLRWTGCRSTITWTLRSACVARRSRNAHIVFAVNVPGKTVNHRAPREATADMMFTRKRRPLTRTSGVCPAGAHERPGGAVSERRPH
ncbi:Transposase InsO and inactivated derivatives [Streptomyces yunnanensis]|uniref:Transposase InsO and inactivated derivatives n=1 Tax=Streptomyces yunnanensis TaxID=156453 RepID=A0A9X8N9P0_9ACTN|nr:Transposase InsO and inactivated derivatives [Streptomyces yunnanensis]